jgi:rSAM/selenodomain-associated transferase 2
MGGVSVIIPTFDEADRIGGLITSLRTQGFEEIIVVDASVTDATVTAAKTAGACTLRLLTPQRSRQMQAGADVATGDILFFLHADSRLPIGARQTIEAALQQEYVVAGSFRLAFDVKHPLLSFYGLCSRLNWTYATYGDQGLFVSRAGFARVGGFEDMALLEDVEIQLRLRRLGHFCKVKQNIVTSARRFVRRGVLVQQLINVAIIVAYRCGVSTAHLARWYRGRAK